MMQSCTYDTANDLTLMTGPNGTTNFTYDDWGRLTGKTRSAQSTLCAYRYGHYLSGVVSTLPEELAWHSNYTGGDGKLRNQSNLISSIKIYRWDAGYTILNELDGSGDLERTYVGRNTAQIEGDDATTGDYLYHLHDHLGTTQLVYNQSVDTVASFAYMPQGEEMLGGNRSVTTRGFTGHVQDPLMRDGAYYAPFRYYFPNLARWEKRDPLGMVDGPNVYAYVRGNPVGAWDILGLFGCDETDWDPEDNYKPDPREHQWGDRNDWENLGENLRDLYLDHSKHTLCKTGCRAAKFLANQTNSIMNAILEEVCDSMPVYKVQDDCWKHKSNIMESLESLARKLYRQCNEFCDTII